MARKTATIVIDADNRDKGQTYIVTEMNAVDGAKLSFQLFQLLASAGVDIDIQAIQEKGVSEVLGILMRVISQVPPEEFDMYRETLMKCVQWQNPQNATIKRALVPSDVEEISTIYRLMMKALEVTVGGFFTEIQATFIPAKK